MKNQTSNIREEKLGVYRLINRKVEFISMICCFGWNIRLEGE